MSNSIFKIYGKKRREHKKRLAELKQFVKMFWHYEDIDRFYGGGLPYEKCNEILAQKQLEIENLKAQLAKRH